MNSTCNPCSVSAIEQVSSLELVKRQHKTYFPIVNDPCLLSAYVLDFFGPDGAEPILSYRAQIDAHDILEKRCEQWHRSCKKRAQKIIFVEDDGDKSTVSEDEFKVKLELILTILENSDHLLKYVAKVFGPSGPDGLAITDQELWDELDDLFLCRLPYPETFPTQKIASIEVIAKPQPIAEPPASTATPSQGPLIEAEVITACSNTPIDPLQQRSTLETVSLCALGAGAAVLGGCAVVGLGRFLVSPAGTRVIGEVLSTALSGLNHRLLDGSEGVSD
ncbi:hypothetical protein KBY65_13310 [Cyanobium sp. Alchichica 3B3-8F6]|uniref:hypothetical protein n=1 Tax=Cyanobium sp. Alchichica 3B3-8F6 TaxID=2823696 RepID=UPI0020CDF64F|nr:hypothetical protein [Cyanobium sp. Alchichica 3B3-8F6]MCP9883433.1 hypothetical protein [Cyanobium sp. Alchichica 3B3-8F6]